MAVLDLVGVLLFGLVGVLVASLAQGAAPPSPVPGILDALGMSDMDPATAGLILGLLAAGFLLAKGLGVLLVSRKTTQFLAGRAIDVSVRLVTRFMDQSLLAVQSRPSHETSLALTRGVSAAIQDTLGAAIMVTADAVLLGLLGVSLFIIDPWITVGAAIYFFAIASLMHRVLGASVTRAGRAQAEADIASYRDIQDSMATFRELTVADRVGLYRNRILGERDVSIRARAQVTWASQIPRFGMEIALVLGAAGLTAALLLTKNTDAAVGSLALFLAAGSRVMPALMRANAARLNIRGASGEAEFSLKLAARLESAQARQDQTAGCQLSEI